MRTTRSTWNPVWAAAVAAAIVVGGGVGPLASPATAQDEAPERTEGEMLRDFIHFVRIANYEVAGAVGFELLDAGLGAGAFADLVDEINERERFTRAIREAMRVPELEPLASEMDRLFREGMLGRARDPEQIARNIELLTGGLRARSLGRERLIGAGEYAMPQLLEAFLQNKDIALKAQVQRVIVDMGRQAIIPLTTALPELDPARQEAVAEVLGLIPYRTSLPALEELRQTARVNEVRQAATAAISRLGGGGDDLADLYASLAGAYYDERLELTSFPDESLQLLWDYDPGLGLVMMPIRTEVFHEARAMASAEKALMLRPESRQTLALWIASNFSREIDQAEGYDNPAYAPDRRPAAYFAIASGAEVGQRVLARAIDNGDTPLALRSIAAVQRTAGPRAMLAGGARQPLLEALSYRNRRVQYESALAIGMAQPSKSFAGSERVVPLLASAVRDASARFAVVLSGTDAETYDRVRGLLEAEGYTVLPPALGGIGDIRAAIAETPGIDLVVTKLSLTSTLATLETIRNTPALSVTPVLTLMAGSEIEPIARQYRRDQTIAVRRASINDDEVSAAAEQIVLIASGGPIGADEAAEYVDRSLAVLRDLAVSGNAVLKVGDAAVPLIAVMEQADGLVLLEIAEVLAHVKQDRAQAALAQRAVETDDEIERLDMLGMLADSGKRFGSMLDERLTRRLVQLATDDDDATATSAAAALGALGVHHGNVIPLILEGARSSAGADLGG